MRIRNDSVTHDGPGGPGTLYHVCDNDSGELKRSFQSAIEASVADRIYHAAKGNYRKAGPPILPAQTSGERG